MGKILLLGYFGAGNLGDDGFVVDFLKRWQTELRAHGQTCDYTAAGGRDPLEGFIEADEVRPLLGSAVSRKALLTVRPRDYDAMVAPGGSLLQNATSMRSLLFYLHIISRFANAQVPVYMLGQGLGPFKGKLAGGLVAKTLKHVKLLTLRDKASYEWAQKNGLESIVSADCLLAGRLNRAKMPPREQRSIPYFVFVPKPTKTQIDLSQEGLVATHVDHHLKAGHESFLGQAIFLDQIEMGFEADYPEVVALHKGEDSKLANQLSANVGSGNLDSEKRPAEEALALIGGADIVVSYRLHGLILGAAYGVPGMGIAYDPKVAAFCDELGFPHCSPKHVGGSKSNDLLHELWDNREQVKATMIERRTVALQRLEAAEGRFAELMWGAG